MVYFAKLTSPDSEWRLYLGQHLKNLPPQKQFSGSIIVQYSRFYTSGAFFHCIVRQPDHSYGSHPRINVDLDLHRVSVNPDQRTGMDPR